MVFGLEGFEIGDNEADEYPVKPASDGEQGDDVHYSVKDAFEFVHGFGFSGWKKMCVGEPHPSVGLQSHFIAFPVRFVLGICFRVF